MIYRCILPQWAQTPGARRVWEGEFSEERIEELNKQHYNIYFLPNYPSHYDPSLGPVIGAQIDTFNYVFADMDLKEGKYSSKEEFIERVLESKLPPSAIIDSGNGVHVYWVVSDLDAMSFLKLQRRIIREFNTDEAVGQIYQLMRVPGTLNTKKQEDFKPCISLYGTEQTYTCEELDRLLPPLTHEDLQYCEQHYNKTYNASSEQVAIDEKIPDKFNKLLRKSKEVHEIWCGNVDDRSKADYRLGHIMFSSGFSKDEARSVLVNSPKALGRSPVHRISYADNIIDKIWTYELSNNKDDLSLSQSVRQILERGGEDLKGRRFPCNELIDATCEGFRLGQVIGLVAGSGVGKTAMALNMFMWFAELNPESHHFFVPLEQPAGEIADRWRTMCGENTNLQDKVHVISNYADDGTFRHLSFEEIREYIMKFKEKTGRTIGCIVIDHIGALKKEGKDGENQDLMDICHSMKAFAIQTNTLLVMQSQSSREKAGIGDLELNKDAAYGTVYFESYCDYLITIWQPLKRCYSEEMCPSITAFKFCKIRHKKKGKDKIKEDVPYRLYFDPVTERMRELTEDEEKSFDFFNKKATNKRKLDRKTDILSYESTAWVGTEKGSDNGRKADHNKDSSAA